MLFVEGKDFQILSRFALRLGQRGVANRRDFAVVPVEGFNPERIRSLKTGMETTLGGKVLAGAIFDRDYRNANERAAVQAECETFCAFAVVHQRKEIENFLLVPEAMDRALQQRLEDRARRGGATTAFEPLAGQVLDSFSASKKAYVAGQLASGARAYGRIAEPRQHETEVMEAAYADIEIRWATPEGRSALIPGKEVFGEFNRLAQERYSANVTPTAVIAAMMPEQVSPEMRDLIETIRTFTTTKPG